MSFDPLAKTLVLDTSVLVNFLVVDRLALLPGVVGAILITDHVREEITDAYPEQIARYDQGLGAGLFQVLSVSEAAELEAFKRLSSDRVLGVGECSAIALAGVRRYGIGLDDKQARNKALAAFPTLQIFGTKDLIVAAIQHRLLTLADADALKAAWETEHRFPFKFASFSDVLPHN
ncbi:hypothetical protein IT571_10190 [Candidatus Sumerlaeota bacterium]|nr:hypothetical protein [Candidatus Sumerlaeota bacterium]